MVEQFVVAGAGEGEFVDVSGAAGGPFLDVVHLAQVARRGAAGCGAATVLGVQHDPLIGRRDPLGPPEVERAVGVLVEDRQVVGGVGGHADQIPHG